MFLLACFVSVSCDDEPTTKKTGKIEFTFSSTEQVSGGRSKTLQAVLVSISDASGNIVHDRKKIPLIQFGSEYLSEAISLTTGDFQLTEFIVIDENNAAIYATPVEGSPLAHLVNDPLSIDFRVQKDQTTKVTPQVIKVDGNTGPDFGYATFSFDIVETFKFHIGVLAYNSGSSNFELTTSHLIISSSGETLFNGDLAAVTNEITVKDGYANYTLSVTKAGYLPYEKTFSSDELKAYLPEASLAVTLLNESLSEGLIAYYPFSGNAQDGTDNNFDGTVNGAVLTTDRKGAVNSAYLFDGVNDYISVPHHADLNLTGDFTISLWTNISPSQEPHEGINDILRKWNGNAEGYPFSISYLNTLADDAHEDKILYVRYDGQGCGNAPTSYSPLITNDTFVHVVLIKVNGKLRHYLNNVLVAEIDDTTDASGCSVGNTANMTIGCRGNLVRFFKGKIDDIRIYGRGISESEVASLYAE
jgi:hypothetical protein